MGSAIVESLRHGMPGTAIRQVQAGASGLSVELVEQGAAQIALAQADTVYLAFQRNQAERGPDVLRGVAVLYPSVMHLVASDHSGIRSLGDLRGRRVAMGAFRGAHTEAIARLVLAASGLTIGDIEPVWLPRAEIARGLVEGRIDAAFRPGGFTGSEAAGRLRLIPVSGAIASQIREGYPFLRPMIVPPATYSEQHQPVDCIGTDVMLVSRSDLSNDIVYRLIRTLVSVLPDMATQHPVLRSLRLDAISATPIPLHDGALRFYREQTLFK